MNKRTSMKNFWYYFRRHPIHTLRTRLDRWVERTIYPQRPFMTFGEGGQMTNVDLYEIDGHVIIQAAANSQIHNVNFYDVMVNYDKGSEGSFISDGVFVMRKPMSRDDAIIRIRDGAVITGEGET